MPALSNSPQVFGFQQVFWLSTNGPANNTSSNNNTEWWYQPVFLLAMWHARCESRHTGIHEFSNTVLTNEVLHVNLLPHQVTIQVSNRQVQLTDLATSVHQAQPSPVIRTWNPSGSDRSSTWNNNNNDNSHLCLTFAFQHSPLRSSIVIITQCHEIVDLRAPRTSNPATWDWVPIDQPPPDLAPKQYC